MPNSALLKLRSDQLAASTAKSLSPVYLLSGDETLLLNECADTVRAACRAAGYTERVLLNVDRSFDWRDLNAELAGMSLFVERRLIELRMATVKPGKKGQEALLSACENLPPDTVLLIQAPRLDKTVLKTAWVSAVERAGVLVQVWPIDDSEFSTWVAARMRQRGLAPERDAVLAFCARVEGNLLAAAQEIDKLWLLNGEGPLSAETVAEQVGDNARFNVYKLADTTLAGQHRKAFRVLRSLRLEGVEPVLLLWALGREIRALYAIQVAVDGGADVGSAMKKARVWGQRQGLVRGALARHDTASLAELLVATERADRAARGRGQVDVWDHITGIVFALAAGRESTVRGAA